jgi:hypothetical protein
MAMRVVMVMVMVVGMLVVMVRREPGESGGSGFFTAAVFAHQVPPCSRKRGVR